MAMQCRQCNGKSTSTFILCFWFGRIFVCECEILALYGRVLRVVEGRMGMRLAWKQWRCRIDAELLEVVWWLTNSFWLLGRLHPPDTILVFPATPHAQNKPSHPPSEEDKQYSISCSLGRISKTLSCKQRIFHVTIHVSVTSVGRCLGNQTSQKFTRTCSNLNQFRSRRRFWRRWSYWRR